MPPLFTKYPVGVGVPVEARFLNVGLQEQNNVPVEYEIRRQGESTVLFRSNSVIPGAFPSATFRDFNMPTWAPVVPGTYCVRIWSNLPNDEDHGNDTIPVVNEFCFTSAYEIELAAVGTQQLVQLVESALSDWSSDPYRCIVPSTTVSPMRQTLLQRL